MVVCRCLVEFKPKVTASALYALERLLHFAEFFILDPHKPRVRVNGTHNCLVDLVHLALEALVEGIVEALLQLAHA